MGPMGGAVAGVFVGGAGRRMGGCAKGMLPAPDGGTLVERWLRVLRDAGVERVVLVGRRDEYGPLGLETLDDEPAGVGPIGGLAALLRRAGGAPALSLACDMPFVTTGMVARLLSAPDAPVVAARRDGIWEPLCARYDAARVLPAARRRIAEGRLSLQPLLTECGAVDVSLGDQELRDWDTPEDVR
jgi:molybdopterin-guanine dinucleotide biosynthesis protein A